MELWEILKQKYEFGEYKIDINGCTAEYYIADYYIRKNRFLRYYVLDLRKNNNFNLTQWHNMKEFQLFQETLLEDDFFSSIGDERYNIYLVFIVSEQMPFLSDFDIQNDFQYARKIILQESEMENFFLHYFPLIRKSGESSFSVNGVIRQKAVREKLVQYTQDGIDLFRQEFDVYNMVFQSNKGKKPSDIISPKLLMNLAMCMTIDKEKPKAKSKKEKNTISNLQAKNYNIKKIIYLHINNFRHFREPCRIPFKKVNLIYGDNGVGKTSILNAIELGITGYNRGIKKEKLKDTNIKIICKNSKEDEVSIFYGENNLELSQKWYGICAENVMEFNKFFNQYNYFDTSWASAFAIEGEERVNIKQLQKFLGIEDLKKYEEAVKSLYESIKEIAEKDKQSLEKLNSDKSTFNFLKKEQTSGKLLKMIEKNKTVSLQCQSNLANLQKDIELVASEEVLREHLAKIESIFKLLVCSDECTALGVQGEEIVVSRSKAGENVSMSKMSTGQKVCLALAFMFALFLSNETAPDFIMLDEPVANLDDLHMLNLLDLLRRLALSGTQIFFTTANPDVAKLFRRKFSYLEEDLGVYRIADLNNSLKIEYEQYSQKQDNPVRVETLYEKKEYETFSVNSY